MKKLKLFVMTVIAISLAACGTGGSINPTSKKVNGPLGKFFEVVERDYKINDGKLGVEFKRIAEGGPDNASWSSEPTFTVELQDEDGNVIETISTNVVRTEDELESVFSLGVDETASITFVFDKTDGAAKFKVSSKWKGGDNETTDEPATNSSGDQTVDLRGTVDIYPVTMHLEISGSQVKGSYYYDKKGPDAQLNLVGTSENDILDINETDADGTPTGHFKGKFSNGMFTGQFITNKGKKMPFKLSEGDAEGDAEDISFDDDSSSYDDSDTSSSGSEDWDALLASYESYVDKYISYVKKAAKGDMTALAEYPSLMEKAQEFSEKLEKAKGDMSASQWARYNKITMKMMKAAQEMQP